MKAISYKIYPTLLDCFMCYQDSDVIYDKYWGFSEDPPQTPEEFHQLQFQGLIDKINRVPFDSEAADKGTAFNEVVDCLIEKRNSDKVKIEKIKNNDCVVDVMATYNNRIFTFDINLLREFADYYKGALTQ